MWPFMHLCALLVLEGSAAETEASALAAASSAGTPLRRCGASAAAVPRTKSASSLELAEEEVEAVGGSTAGVIT